MSNIQTENIHLEKILAIYQALRDKPSNLVIEILPPDNHHMNAWEHYPKGEVIDKQTHFQYYYHSHPSHSPDRIPEHGHFHVFARLAGIPKALAPIYVSEKYKNEKKDALCHLFAIAMDDYALPRAFFTTNHWVSRGLWYTSDDIMQFIDDFAIKLETPSSLTNQWLTHLVQLFMPQIKELLYHRDYILNEWQAAHPDGNVFETKELEVLSLLSLHSNPA